MKKMDFNSFKTQIKKLPDVVYSIGEERIPYSICSLQGNVLTVQRESTKKFVELNLDELYKYFTQETTHNTQTARNHITTGYAYSPAAAVINAIKENQYL